MSSPSRPPRSPAREYLEPLGIALILALFVRTFLLQAFQIPTPSMEDNLLVGDHILVNKFVLTPWDDGRTPWLPTRPVRRGDVVVFKFPAEPERDFVKRCMGLPGEEIELRDKQLLIDGDALDEPWAIHADSRTYPRSLLLPEQFSRRDNFGPQAVPGEHYFCLGDNRDNSNDSRNWGPVPRSYVKGRALAIYWSYTPPSAPAPGGPLASIAHRWNQLMHFGDRTRWERTFELIR